MKKGKKGVVVCPSDFNGVNWIEKLKANGLNTLGIHSGGGNGRDVLAVLGEYGKAEFRQQVADAGLDYEYELHASKNLLPESLFETHPEYFVQALHSKIRTQNLNWCVTAPGVLENVIAENAAGLAKSLPSSTHNYFFWGCDSAPGRDWCHCPACSIYSFSEQNLLSVNAMARRLRLDDPEAQIAYLAYYATMPAPQLVKPESNVFCEFAPYSRSLDYAICDRRSAANRQYVKYLMDQLALYGPEKIHILEYWLDASLWGKADERHPSPFNKKICEEDVRFYTSLGIRHFTTFAVRQDGAYVKLHGDREISEYAEILAKYE